MSLNICKNGTLSVVSGRVADVEAKDVDYKPSSSGLSATKVQSAIDEIADDIGEITEELSDLDNGYINNMVTATGTGSLDIPNGKTIDDFREVMVILQVKSSAGVTYNIQVQNIPTSIIRTSIGTNFISSYTDGVVRTAIFNFSSKQNIVVTSFTKSSTDQQMKLHFCFSK